MPDANYVLREDLTNVERRLSEEIHENRATIMNNSEAIVKLETLYGTLVKLPDTIDSLKETVIGINTNLQAMNDKIGQIQSSFIAHKEEIKEIKSDNKKQDELIERVDRKGKVDWIDFITDNFWKVILAVGILYLMVKDTLSL